MKRLIMCDGPNELTVINILLRNNALVFTEDDLLGLTAYHARQISKSPQVKVALSAYPCDDVLVMRVGDTQNDKLSIPPDFKSKISTVEKYCTKPEIEMLLIISEGMFREYDKVKSSVSPKAFAKANIFCNRLRYNNSTRFFEEYYGNDCNKLTYAIREYKRIKATHKKDELYLADILRQGD